MNKLTLYPDASDARLRLDVFLAEELAQTRSAVSNLLRNGLITVNGEKQKSGYAVKPSDCIEVTSVCAQTDIIPQDIPLDILYQDHAVAVLNKPAGMTVHPGGGCNTGTLANALLYRFPQLLNTCQTRPGIVHRLDKDTSGVMVAALTASAHQNLSAQFAARSVNKIYVALLEGNLKSDRGEIITLIGRDPQNRKLMRVVPRDGREAVTHYKVLQRFTAHCLTQFQILTGRTHQIRVHAKHLGHPVVGDAAYGYKKQRFTVSGQLLHAQSLSFTHPESAQNLTFTAPIPPQFERILEVIK
ncbi:MAG: RluA family pseudouridine synthase [Firmicutes bacterium]|nr:RluA family pseudouridine synthase [Bacillota bacterium]